MASAITLGSTPKKTPRPPKGSVPEPAIGTCKCAFNPRLKRDIESCFIGKSAKHRSGWKFSTGRGGCPR